VRTVCRSTVNFPRRVFPQLCVKPRKVEALGSPVAPASPVGRREAAKFDETRLVGMQRQPERRDSLAQLGEELLGLPPMLESHNEVIGKAHDHHLSARLLLPPPLDPEIEHVVQIEVGQQRADDSSHAIANFAWDRAVPYQRLLYQKH
jgi:hypothetical protein